MVQFVLMLSTRNTFVFCKYRAMVIWAKPGSKLRGIGVAQFYFQMPACVLINPSYYPMLLSDHSNGLQQYLKLYSSTIEDNMLLTITKYHR